MTTGLGGTYKAVVLDNQDPMAQSRLLVTVPDVGLESVWASSLSGSSPAQIPSVGDEVFVQFEGGDSDHPVWHSEGSAASTAANYPGVYRATVVDNLDPAQSNRLQVQVPDVLGSNAEWATPSPSLGTVSDLPAVGTGVWVEFDGGDPNHPVWTGVQ